MRLDHLLSKEHLVPKGTQEPTSAERAGGVLEGGDTGQSGPATVLRVSTAGVPVWKAVGDAAGFLAYKLAPCWVSEGTTEIRHCAVRLVFNARQDSERIPAGVPVLVGSVVGLGLVVG